MGEVTFMIARDQYMEQLKAYKDNELIKVVTGLRRCGKSTLLQLFKADLKQNGVPDDYVSRPHLWADNPACSRLFENRPSVPSRSAPLNACIYREYGLS